MAKLSTYEVIIIIRSFNNLNVNCIVTLYDTIIFSGRFFLIELKELNECEKRNGVA